MCNPIIENNSFIGNNRKAGIRLQDDSHAEIQRNEIFENVCQGILLVTGCDANIEDN